jgi:uncharacterized membrane protein
MPHHPHHPHPPRGGHARLLPALKARPRLLWAMVVGVLAYALLAAFTGLTRSTASLLSWNAGALLNLGLTWSMTRATDADAIQRRAPSQDEGRGAILTVVVLAAMAVMLAVGTQLAQVRDLAGAERVAHIALAALTVLTAWMFTHVVFGLHYAHEFYTARLRGEPDPLAFPGTADPTYADFFHFAFVIGASSQTADIAFNGSMLRPVGTLHCAVAFFFNASLLALAINVVAGGVV